MYVANALFRQLTVAVRVRDFAAHGSISRVPIHHKVLGLHRRECPGGFGASRGVALMLILEKQDDVLLRRLVTGLTQLVIDGRSIRRDIVKSPEIKDADAIGVEGSRQLYTALQ